MLAPFAQLQDSTNTTVMATLANAVALVVPAAGGAAVQVGVIFDQPFADPFVGDIDGASPECTGAVADVGHLQRDDAVTVAGVAYKVQRTEPDGTGLVRLQLYRVEAP